MTPFAATLIALTLAADASAGDAPAIPAGGESGTRSERQSVTVPCAASQARASGAVPPSSSSGSDGGWRPVYVYSLDHEGALGLSLGLLAAYRSTEKSTCLSCKTEEVALGFDGILDVAATLGVGWEGAELVLRFQMSRLDTHPGEAVSFGFRHYFGKDEWKTFLGLELVGAIRPLAGGGLRPGFGIQWDFSPVFGLWAEAAGQFVLGKGRTFGAQLGIGVQARSYLF